MPVLFRGGSSPDNPVILVDEGDDTDSSCTIGRGSPSPVHLPEPAQPTFSEDDFMDDEDFEAFLSSLSPTSRGRISKVQRDQPPALTVPTRTTIDTITSQGKVYRPGKTVELENNVYLRIKNIQREDGDGKILLRGWRLERLEDMDGLMPDRANELCWVVDVDEGQRDEGVTLAEIDLEEVKRLRIVRFTNQPYCQDYEREFGSVAQFREEGFLFCRVKYTRIWNKFRHGRKRVTEDIITYLTSDECDPAFYVLPKNLRQRWRGTQPLPQQRGEREHQYTFGDAFCGAGGVSRGAQQAGLVITWGFDHSINATNSYRSNFTDAIGETSDVADFLTNDSKDIMADIMHASPPCQTFSPAKTIASASDEANEACIFSIRRLLEKVRPRMATMEETSGLKERHKMFLFATIHTFVDLGYSVCWKVLNCDDYGVPQRRKRLIVLASGPGETLPPLPAPTHGDGPGQLPQRTILDAIKDIPSWAEDHDLERAERPFHRPPYNPETLAKTLTCSGGDNFHPSGTRTFTRREAACLQTFPLEHRFCAPAVLKQIGNAVPPMLAKSIFKEIIQVLHQTDTL